MSAPNDFGTHEATRAALEGLVYFLEPGTRSLPDLKNLQPKTKLYANRLDVTARNFRQGFPGVDKRIDWFAIRYSGNFTVTKDGEYTFRVLSDDGSVVYVDGAKLIDNDGVHPPKDKSASVKLAAGEHQLMVDYFQGPRWQVALQLWVTPPGDRERLWSRRF